MLLFINALQAQSWEELNNKAFKYYNEGNFEESILFEEKALVAAEEYF